MQDWSVHPAHLMIIWRDYVFLNVGRDRQTEFYCKIFPEFFE